MEPLSKLNLVESFFKVLVEVGILTTAASMVNANVANLHVCCKGCQLYLHI